MQGSIVLWKEDGDYGFAKQTPAGLMFSFTELDFPVSITFWLGNVSSLTFGPTSAPPSRERSM
jgi:hypothetical protein